MNKVRGRAGPRHGPEARRRRPQRAEGVGQVRGPGLSDNKHNNNDNNDSNDNNDNNNNTSKDNDDYF